MNQTELVAAVADAADLTNAAAAKALGAVLKAISDALATGEDVRVTGFGTFSAVAREARQSRNPRTGEAVQVAAATVPRFSAAKALKAAVNS